jgi:Tfp pilus assembly protein FimT
MTLFEMCLSVGILTVMSFFAAPSIIQARNNYQLDQVTRQVAANTQWTRVKAISRSRDCRVRVTSNTSYVMECLDPVWITDQTITLPSGFQISANAAPDFHKRGNAAPAATLTIWDSHGSFKQVVINITGRVRVQ